MNKGCSSFWLYWELKTTELPVQWTLRDFGAEAVGVGAEVQSSVSIQELFQLQVSKWYETKEGQVKKAKVTQ